MAFTLRCGFRAFFPQVSQFQPVFTEALGRWPSFADLSAAGRPANTSAESLEAQRRPSRPHPPAFQAPGKM